jgi:hypothetical protein
MQPNWLVADDTPARVLDTNYGFDSKGMWFTGDSNGGEETDVAYPVRTSFEFEETDVAEIIFTIDRNEMCADHGVAFFAISEEPEWNWGVNDTRIAGSVNCALPGIYGRTEENETDTELTSLGIYTVRLKYDPTVETDNTTLTIYSGKSASVTPIMEPLTLTGVLQSGNYKIGFDADQDDFGVKSYFTKIKIYKNGDLIQNVEWIEPNFSCARVCEDAVGFNCKLGTDECGCTTWRKFNANCPKSNRQCSKYSSAYVPAITVCTQKLI